MSYVFFEHEFTKKEIEYVKSNGYTFYLSDMMDVMYDFRIDGNTIAFSRIVSDRKVVSNNIHEYTIDNVYAIKENSKVQIVFRKNVNLETMTVTCVYGIHKDRVLNSDWIVV